jgi:hypothetical protein
MSMETEYKQPDLFEETYGKMSLEIAGALLASARRVLKTLHCRKCQRVLEAVSSTFERYT